MMKKGSFCVFMLLVGKCFLVPGLLSQQKNEEIASIVKEISADSLRQTVERLVAFGTRHTLSDTNSPTRGIGAARRWIGAEFTRFAADAGGRMTVAFHGTVVPKSARVPASANIVNVVATLYPKDRNAPGADRLILITGHYDSRASDVMDIVSDAPGANDDGSGTALVLELARVLSRRTFDATIMFAALAGEEQGLLGATALADEAFAKGWKIEAVLNNDIVGNSMGGDGTVERSYVRVFSQSLSPSDTGAALRQRVMLGLEYDGASRTLARYVTEIARRYVPSFEAMMVYRLDRFLRGGDHRPFHGRGFAAVRFSVAREHFDQQHQNIRMEGDREYGDLPQFMDFEYCANVARVNAATAASLVSAPSPPTGVRMRSSGLEYTTTLSWNKNSERDVDGYRILYRPTTSNLWDVSTTVQDTTITLPHSKDDFLFGVQAVDTAGNISLPSIPLPGR